MERKVDRLMTVAEVADMFSVTEQTVRNWAKDNKLTPVKINGSLVRFYESDVRDLIWEASRGCEDE